MNKPQVLIMNKRHPDTCSEAGALYDGYTDLFSRALGDNIHVGYWDDEADDSPVELATNRLTDLVAERLATAYVEGYHLLDVGCGHGSTALRITANHAVQITGISVSQYQVDWANSRPQPCDLPGRATFSLADAMKLPFADRSFDGAFAIESLMHMEDKEAAIVHIARVLRPGGRLVVAEAYLDGELDHPDVALMADTYAFFKISLNPDGYQQLVQEAGLKVMDFTDISENIRRTYDVLASAWRDAARNLDDETAIDECITAADLTEWFGRLPQVRYGLLTAVRS
jgi:ubiquinone/menaquinone biosynthesis C-methylase UbiE